MLRHYLLTALRNARRHRATTAVNILGLALGLTFLIVAYGGLTILDNGDRNFANSDRIHFIAQFAEREGRRSCRAESDERLASYLRADYPDLALVSHAVGGGEMPIVAGTRKIFFDVAFADPQFLRVFGYYGARCNYPQTSLPN